MIRFRLDPRSLARRAACIAWALVLCLSTALPATAVQPDEVLKDPALEARARALSAELRCIVCQNQSIDDSNAPLARDLRIILRERLTAGDTDRQAVDYIVARYGNFVLLKPPFQLNTFALWLGPIILLILAVWGFRILLGRQRRDLAQAPEPLSQDERKDLQKILKEDFRP